MIKKLLPPIPPGEILLEDFIKPLSISINQLARDLDVPPNCISGIVNGKRAITADTALRLAKYFATSPDVWIGLQKDYELRIIDSTAPNHARHPGQLRLSGQRRLAETWKQRDPG